MNKIGLLPLLDENTKVLILGSFPGQESLEKKQYYINSRNQFWRLMKEILGWKAIPDEYNKRCNLLLNKGIGLWDVLESCSRVGSSDNKIRNIKANKIDQLLKEYSRIKAVFCNGKTAYEFLSKTCFVTINSVYLPSSSPAHAVPFNIKLKEWWQIKEYL